jgi:hypothetical protein
MKVLGIILLIYLLNILYCRMISKYLYVNYNEPIFMPTWFLPIIGPLVSTAIFFESYDWGYFNKLRDKWNLMGKFRKKFFKELTILDNAKAKFKGEGWIKDNNKWDAYK